MGYVSAGAAIVGLAMSAYGMYAQGEQQKDMYDYQAKLAERDAQNAEYAAQDAERRGQIEEKQARLRTANLIGSQTAAFGGSGVSASTGSPLDITSDTAAWGEWDAQTIRSNTAKEVWGIRNMKQNYLTQADIYKISGTNAYQSGMWKAGGSVISGAGSVSDKWSSWFPGGGKTYYDSALQSYTASNPLH